MPTKKNSRKRDEDGKFVSENAVVSRLDEMEENPVPKRKGEFPTRHGGTTTYS